MNLKKKLCIDKSFNKYCNIILIPLLFYGDFRKKNYPYLLHSILFYSILKIKV